MNQKRKKGFTLIELLAVIVILAIIALIAVPIIMNIINKANKSAFKDTAYGVIQAGELYFAEQQLEPNGMSGDVTFDLPDTTKQLVLKGEVPKGTITITEEGKISIAVTNGRYCATKGLEERDVTITEDVENCTPGGSNPGDISELAVGDPVYFNPVENRLCDKNTEYVPGNSATGFKDGCMKWYVYKIDGDNISLILDHNTTTTVAWYKDNDDTTANETNEKGPLTLKAQLKSDTANWQIVADIIDMQDILNLLPWYESLEDKTTWESQYNTDMKAAEMDVLTRINANIGNYANKLETLKATSNMLTADYSDIALPSYLYEDLLDNCDDDWICTTYGYWTKTATEYNSYAAWYVGDAALMGSFYVRFDSYDNNGEYDLGLRPVVTITKNIENNTPGDTSELALGDPVYFNPVTNSICTNYANRNSTTGVTDGCLRWYVYKQEDNKNYLILDHNTSVSTALISESDMELFETIYASKNEFAPITLSRQLSSDTKNWIVEPNIITIEELISLLPWYQNLDDKTNWQEKYMEQMELVQREVPENIKREDYETEADYMEATVDYIMSKGMAAPKYMYQDILDGYLNENLIAYGYWTSSIDMTNQIMWGQMLYMTYPMSNPAITTFGLRPSIVLEDNQAPLKEKTTELYMTESIQNMKMIVGDTLNISMYVEPYYNCNNNILKFTSSNENVATVDANGVITAKTVGTTTITISTVDGSNIIKNIDVTVANMSVNGIMSSRDECINTGTCEQGTLINVAVNDSKTYGFYVLKDTGSELTLLMDRNLGDNLAWYANSYNLSSGPATAISALKQRTSDWTNITEREYTYSDDSGYDTYAAFTETMKARMITYTEANNIMTANNGVIPEWMRTNLRGNGDNSTDGYWTSATSGSGYHAYGVRYDGDLYFGFTTTNTSSCGVRPVITITK